MYACCGCSNTCKTYTIVVLRINYTTSKRQEDIKLSVFLLIFLRETMYPKVAALIYIRRHKRARFWTPVKVFCCIPYMTSYCCVAFETFHRHIFMAAQFFSAVKRSCIEKYHTCLVLVLVYRPSIRV